MMRRQTPSEALDALVRGLVAAVFLFGVLWLGAGCSSVQVNEESPQLASTSFSCESSMTEASQRAQVKLSFDRAISVEGDVLSDFEITLNGEPIDSRAISVEARTSGEAITLVLSPAPEAKGLGSGSYFALYAADISVRAQREDGALPSVKGVSGSCAVLESPVEGTMPSGLRISVEDTRAGSSAAHVAAQTTFTVVCPAQIRAITWFSPDGGETILLKHNHEFDTYDAADAAEDLANVVNAASGLGITAQARGAEVTLTATSVNDGQVIEPMVVEGVGVEGGTYDAFAASDRSA